ncbi:LysE family transporter [Microvirga sp. BSC39]|uniref:LysE family translocator n=1 Tax=Microvirga sp. BSC39 TaxID=1549810 RepID=UPI00068CD36D|nr:LysE family transporter [Microvirga sp. BSC39]
MMSVSVATFLAGVGVGLTVAVPIGPIGVLCIQKTLAFGLLAGVATGMAAATVHVTYGILAGFGYSQTITAHISAGASVLSLACAAIMFWFAVRTFRRKVVLESADAGKPLWPLCLLQSYRDALVCGFTNPLTIVLFFAAFPALTSADQHLELPFLTFGIFAGAAGWFFILSAAVAVFRARLPEHRLTLANKAAGCVFAVLGCLMIADALGLRPN